MGLIFWMLLGVGLAMGGLIALLQTGHKGGGLACLVFGALLVLLPLVFTMGPSGEGIWILAFLGSYCFLLPAFRYYKRYRALTGFLTEAERQEREKAFSGACLFGCLFLLGVLGSFCLLAGGQG